MNKRHATLKILISAVLILVALIFFRIYEKSAQTGIYVLDVGQGDSILIQTGKTQMLIDGGRDASVLGEIKKGMNPGDMSIDIVVATHPDEDHIGGLVHVLNRFDIKLFLTTQAISNTETFKEINKILAEKNIDSYYLRQGMKFKLDENTDFTVLFPDRDTENWKTNVASVVGRLDMNGKSYLFMGDAPESIEKFLIETQKENIDVDVLKLGHHGSKTSSDSEFLKATSPELALISSGAGNNYGHPHEEVLNRLKDLNIPWRNTAEEGTVYLESL